MCRVRGREKEREGELSPTINNIYIYNRFNRPSHPSVSSPPLLLATQLPMQPERQLQQQCNHTYTALSSRPPATSRVHLQLLQVDDLLSALALQEAVEEVKKKGLRRALERLRLYISRFAAFSSCAHQPPCVKRDFLAHFQESFQLTYADIC